MHAAGSLADPPARAIGLVLAGHHPLTLCGLSQVLEKEGDCTVLAVCTDPEAVLEAVRQHEPDILILDLERQIAFKVLRRLHRARASTRVIVLAETSDGNDSIDAVRLGARAVLPKELAPEAFVACVRNVYKGESSIEVVRPGRPGARVFNDGNATRNLGRRLTPREAEIARLAVLGISTRDIAARLDVKQGTVKIHLHSIYEKMNVAGRLGLILVARRHGLA